MNKTTNIVTLALAFGTVAGISNAATVALLTDADPGPTSYAAQKWAGTLGIDFHVNAVAGQQVIIKQLGIFDDLQNGFINPASISIYDIGVSHALITTVAVPTGISGTLIGGSKYYNVSSVALLAGHDYSIIADYNIGVNDDNGDGFHTGVDSFPGPGDKDYNTGNSGGGPNVHVTTNTSGSLIQFIGTGRADGHNKQPLYADGGPAIRYNAGSFTYDIVPEPSSIAMFAGLAVTGAGFAFRLRRRCKK